MNWSFKSDTQQNFLPMNTITGNQYTSVSGIDQDRDRDQNIQAGQNSLQNSVADPWHFGVDPDPDPRIHASD